MSLSDGRSLSSRIAWRLRRWLLAEPGSAARALPPQGVAVAGLFRTASGIGQSARACADGLERAGIPVTRVDLSEAFGQAELAPDARYQASPGRAKTLIVHLNGPEFERACFLLGNWRGSGRRTIAYWAWELPVAPSHWQTAERLFSELWVPSQFNADTLGALTRKPVKVVPHYIAAPVVPPQSLPDSSGLHCIALGDGKSSFERKNLAGTVRAFRQASLPAASTLTLKTRYLDASPDYRLALEAEIGSDPRIRIVDGSIPHEAVIAMIASAGVLISLHRSEGFGLTLAEAMLMGKVVVATGWSGNLDFMDETCAVPVPFRLVPARDPSGVYTGMAGAEWAEPDDAFAAAALTRLAADPAFREGLAAAACRRITPFTSGEQYARALGAS